jgi:hypothetical protein
MLNEDCRFNTYDGTTISEVSFNNIFANRRVLICSSTQSRQAWSYYIDLAMAAESYKLLGVDEVYILSESLWTHAFLNEHSPLPSLSDIDNNFLTQLQALQNKTHQDIDFLSKNWAFQILINNGQIEQFYDQPTENYLKSMLKDGVIKSNSKFGHVIREVIMPNEHLIFTPTFLITTSLIPASGIQKEKQDFAKFLYFYRLCPNIKLKQYLLDTCGKTVV